MNIFMEEFYRFDHQTISCTSAVLNDHTVRLENVHFTNDFSTTTSASTSTNDFHSQVGNLLQFDQAVHDNTHHHHQVTVSDMYDPIKTQIANHPRYPDLVSAHIECQKVGAPPEIVSLLEELDRGKNPINTPCEIGADPELDEFMESYCEVLHRYKEELSKPFDEATTFLNSIQSQLRNLCKGTLTKIFDYGSADEPAAGTSEEELSCGELEVSENQESSSVRLCDQNVKGMLLRKYSGHLSKLRKEFLTKKKKGKLPKDARTALLDWWNHHYRWPYPTEEEKGKLSEITGLDQKQINNWFINQRKRHWKPSEDMRFAIMESVKGNIGGASRSYDISGDDM